MVVAKSEIAYSVLKQAFRSRTVDKTYHTLVQGHPDPFVGTIDAPIGRHPTAEYKMAVTAAGRHSVTHYDTLQAFVGTTLLEVHLETGRTHQIRVHMQHQRHPIVGDPLYGGPLKLPKGATEALAAGLRGFKRQALHAEVLEFAHPVGGQPVQVEAPLPADMVGLLRILREDTRAWEESQRR